MRDNLILFPLNTISHPTLTKTASRSLSALSPCVGGVSVTSHSKNLSPAGRLFLSVVAGFDDEQKDRIYREIMKLKNVRGAN